MMPLLFFFSSRRRHTRLTCDWSSDVCSSDLGTQHAAAFVQEGGGVADVLQGVAAPHQVAGAAADRQRLQITPDEVDGSGHCRSGGVGAAACEPGVNQVNAYDPAAEPLDELDRVASVTAAGVAHEQRRGLRVEARVGVQL